MMRSKSITIAGKVSYRDALVALWTRNPTLTTVQAIAITGCPRRVATHVRVELVRRGVLKAGVKGYFERGVAQ